MNKFFSLLALIVIISIPNLVFANDDLKIFLSKEDPDGIKYAFSLPENRQIELAHLLLNDENGIIVYRGSQLLIKNGREQESFSALARIIVEGKGNTHLKGRLGYDWVHSDDSTLFQRMMIGIMGSMNANYSSYQPSEQEISLSFFQRMGYQGNYNKGAIEAHIETLRSKVKQVP